MQEHQIVQAEGLIELKVTDEAVFDGRWDFQVLNRRGEGSLILSLPHRRLTQSVRGLTSWLTFRLTLGFVP